MPVEKVPGGYRWGSKGKVYKQKWKAEKQGRAIEWRKHQQSGTKTPWWKRSKG